MANMDYNRSVSGGGARPKVSFNNNYDFSTFINSYTRTNKNLDNVMQDDGTMDLNLFLEDEVQTVQTQAVVAEAITTQTIENNKVDTVERNPEVAKTEPPKQEEKGFWGKVGDWFKSAGATVAVATTSVISGVADIGEAVLDGGAWVAAKTVGLFSEDAENAIEEFIARDLVSEANEAFYENTELGRAINDASALKYDSELAQGIRSVSEDIGVFVAATALTVCTGGAAAPLVLGIGAAYGLGSAAEDTYATYGTDTTVVQELLILGNGALSALSWYTSGKLGKGFIELGKSMAEAGVKEILAEMCKGIFSKETLKELFKPGNIVGNAIGTLMQAGGDIGLIATKLYNGGEVTPEEWALLVGELIVYFGLNTAEDVLSDAVISYGNPKIDIDTTKTPDTPDTTKPIETLDETGLEDAAPKQPSADTPAPKQNETLDEPEILPEAKTPHPDDEALGLAERILDPNDPTTLASLRTSLDNETFNKVIRAMTEEELIDQLRKMDKADIKDMLLKLDSSDIARLDVENALIQMGMSDQLDKINGLYNKINELQQQLESITDPASRLALEKKIKQTYQAISDANDRMTELSDLQDMARRQCDLLLDEYGENALSEKEIIDILLTDKGQRSDIPYLDVDGDLNKLQLGKFTASQDYKIGDIEIKEGDLSGMKFVTNPDAATNGMVGGFICNTDQIMGHIAEIKAKNPDMSYSDFCADLQKYLDAKGFEGSTVAVFTFDDGDIRIPNGDEYGAWANYWKPGGLTTNGGLEVQTTIDSAGYIDPNGGKYQTMTMEDFYKAIFGK